MKKKRLILILLIIAVVSALGGFALLALHLAPMIQSWMRPEVMGIFQEKLRSFGLWGALLLAGAQFLQVVSGLIPALPIQIAAGLSYGALWGLLICMIGIFLGSTLVFIVVKRYGRPLVDKIFTKDKQNKLAFLNQGKRLESIVFVLYLIPAMPKDVFTYLAALTPLPLRRYLAITLTARVPTILCSTFASGALMEGRYGQAIVVFCITATLGILCMLLSPRIMAFLERRSRHS